MSKFIESFFTVIFVIIIAFLISLLFAWPFMLLWNWLMPMIFGLTTLTFWQAFGLMMLCELMFKSSSSTSNSK
jgi:hypothetical protein